MSITTDFWTNRQMRCFLAITGHYYEKDGFNLKSHVLNFSTFGQQHKACDISKILLEKLIELNILEKVTNVTCDGARNIVPAIKDMDSNVKRLWCLAHRLHLMITNAFGF
ncbi:unnamed protein product [Adineta ricciae]|uniref:DUF659 domain-containing protein n=1 Tax=Adineta ricciae TaxID=249248 RepID=A0A814U2S3_ADIRI|nr:unnamed protein product [Adineta ricciae]CAF1497304.1 unnamed protein product [Adineta ricciae]